MSRHFFVTGTDTEVGKTAISCALLEVARSQGLRTAAVKPVAAGCDEQGCNEDALLLQQHMTAELPYPQVNPVALQAAIAPHIAAEEEGKHVQVARLAGLCRGVLFGDADWVLIEGAGGWRVPLNPTETLADLARELQSEVILVVGMRLGCINHALLTAEAVQRDGLRLAGWVANYCVEAMARPEENLAALQRRLPAPLLGVVPYQSTFSAQAAAKHLSLPV
jgi:dethiobiotin synthetase